MVWPHHFATLIATPDDGVSFYHETGCHSLYLYFIYRKGKHLSTHKIKYSACNMQTTQRQVASSCQSSPGYIRI